MMGQQPPDQNALFYDFCLENHVPQDHLLRQIDPLLDLSPLREHLAPYYSHTGRPSVDPEVMIRMLIVGYCYGIRSERRLCEEVHLNLAYRQLFETVLQRGMAEGLVGGEGFATDASLVKADANRQRHRDDDDDWGGGRAVREYLEALDAARILTYSSIVHAFSKTPRRNPGSLLKDNQPKCLSLNNQCITQIEYPVRIRHSIE
jgi:transposase